MFDCFVVSVVKKMCFRFYVTWRHGNFTGVFLQVIFYGMHFSCIFRFFCTLVFVLHSFSMAKTVHSTANHGEIPPGEAKQKLVTSPGLDLRQVFCMW